MADRTNSQPTRRSIVQGIGALAGATVFAAPAVAAADPTGPAPGAPPDAVEGLDDPSLIPATPGLTYLNVGPNDFQPAGNVPYSISTTGAYVPGEAHDFIAGIPVPSGAVIKELMIGARNSGIATQTFRLYRQPWDGRVRTEVASTTLIPGSSVVRTSATTCDHVVEGDAAYVVSAPTVVTDMVRIAGARVGFVAPPTPGTYQSLAVPIRIYDSRPGTQPPGGLKTKFANHEERVLDARLGTGIPAGASSVLVNIAATNTNPGGFFSLFKNGVAWPNTSTLNWGVANTTVSTLSATQLAANGTFKARCEAPGGADLVVDVVGWFT